MVQALAALPDLLFLDIRMSGQTGLEAAQAIVEDWPAERPLPLIVLVTAYDQYALQAFEASAVDYVLKPVQAERLAATCRRLQGLPAQRSAPAGPAAGANTPPWSSACASCWAARAPPPRRPARRCSGSRPAWAPRCTWCRWARWSISRRPTSTCGC